MKLFVLGALKLPLVWKLWLLILMLVNGVGPLFFLSKTVAVITLVAMVAGAFVGYVLVSVQGFTKLLGLMHLPWVPMVALQIMVVVEDHPYGLFGLWLQVSLTVSLISLVIDVWDIFQYMKGNTTDLLAEI